MFIWPDTGWRTCFSIRRPTSLLQAAELPELIVDTLDEYARLALALAQEPARLDGMREKLARQRAAGTLFNTAEYCRHFEAALTAMVDRHRCGLPPAAYSDTAQVGNPDVG